MDIATRIKTILTAISVLIVLALVGALFSIAVELIKRFIFTFFTLFRDEKEGDIEDRIQNLTASLAQATGFIGEIEEEIKERSKLAGRLKADADRYKRLCSLRSDEVEAITQTLRFELKKESRKSFWSGVFVNSIFFVMGAVASYYISMLLK